jgi:hypothetical protein
MKKLLLAVVVLGSTTVLAQSPFDGVWRMNLENTQYVGKESYNLQNGVFRCTTCDPKIDARADGQDHPASGSPYFDTVNVRIVDDRTVEIVYKKNGKVSSTVKMVASPDGKALNTEFVSVTEGGQKLAGNYASSRVDAAPGSAHRTSGVWQPGKLANASETMRETTYKTTGDRLSMSDKAGNSYTAAFDGKDHPFKGDPGITTVSLRKIDANTIEETYKRDGKTVGVSRMTITAGGKTMSASFHDTVRDVTVKWTADKK